jgi:hypothetical protein
MCHLHRQCQKDRHSGFSNVRFRRRCSFKSVCVIVVLTVSLHHQQSDNFCKIQKKNAKWTWAVIYVWRFTVLSSGAPCIGVYYTSLRARGACPLQGCWLLSLLTWPTVTIMLFTPGTGQNWAARLVTGGSLSVQLWLWHPWSPFTPPPPIWTDVTWHTCLVAISVKN